MAVDFNKADCIENTTANIFGICDDPPVAGVIDQDPAYLSYDNSDSWIAWVDNHLGKQIKFTAIDNCVQILRQNGEKESSCDCMLEYDTTLIFVELKDMKKVFKGAVGQLETTIGVYKANVGFGAFTKFYAYASNKQHPYFNISNSVLAQQFEDKTGFILQVEQVIKVH